MCLLGSLERVLIGAIFFWVWSVSTHKEHSDKYWPKQRLVASCQIQGKHWRFSIWDGINFDASGRFLWVMQLSYWIFWSCKFSGTRLHPRSVSHEPTNYVCRLIGIEKISQNLQCLSTDLESLQQRILSIWTSLWMYLQHLHTEAVFPFALPYTWSLCMVWRINFSVKRVSWGVFNLMVLVIQMVV